MKFRTIVDIPEPTFSIAPCERMLFVGSCFADNIGRRFAEEKFRASVNPFGVMYNPASILHTVERYDGPAPLTTVMTLGTNHVYILRETGEIVDNCRKRPQKLFTEKELDINECHAYLAKAVDRLVALDSRARVILTISPIRYAKYGFHGSALSKAILLLAADRLAHERPSTVGYFPAYEIVNDELRDYRFYREDMLHPSVQAVEYIWERFGQTYFGPDTRRFLEEWKPVKEAFGHRPSDPEAPAYKAFIAEARRKAEALAAKYPGFEL